MCGCNLTNMYRYDEVSIGNCPWGDKPLSYNDECKRCEIEVLVSNDAIRDLIFVEGGLYSDPSKTELGRVLENPVPELRLAAGDRLEPSPSLRDTYRLETCKLPVAIIFWRQHRDERGRLATFTLRRNPLFAESLGTSPKQTIHLDSLHTIYLGVMQTYCHSVIHSALEADVFGCPGSRKARDAANLDRIFVLYKNWCSKNNVDLSYQLDQLTMSMTSVPEKPGLKTKAAETGVFMRFCASFCRDFDGKFQYSAELLAAGECMSQYMQIIRETPFKVPKNVSPIAVPLFEAPDATANSRLQRHA